DEGLSAPAIAKSLNAEGYRPARVGTRFGIPQVTELQRRLGIRPSRPRVRDREPLAAEEWWAAELADRLVVSRSNLHRWIQLGWVRARQEEGRMRRWIVWADEGEVARLQQFSQRSLVDEARQRWTVPAD